MQTYKRFLTSSTKDTIYKKILQQLIANQLWDKERTSLNFLTVLSFGAKSLLLSL